MNRVLFTILFVLFAFGLTAQELDTIHISKKDVSISYRKLKKVWFPSLKNQRYSITIRSEADSIIELSDSPFYLIFYDKKNRLMLEGNRALGQKLLGEVKFYFKSGKLKRVENYAHMDGVAQGGDGTQPWKDWFFYDRKGQLSKTYIHFIDEKHSCVMRKVTQYNKEQTPKRVKTITLICN